MKQCENCGTEITFWMMQKQPTPFRYKCAGCKSRYRIETPGMFIIVGVVVVLTIAMALGLGFGAEIWGLTFVIPCVLVIFVIGFCLELWVQKYIARKGNFLLIGGDDGVSSVEIEETEVDVPPETADDSESDDSESVSASESEEVKEEA